ncbi:ferredoxin [Pseudonocardia thermophila]|uniref:Ferredoxin n=1 Tax=Pseudonocardia thermophila TaxID=1848 RepID=A0A1M6T7Y4_PSETH|nr:ferredoxin [Pseudonocardia thermophila]SHK52949.1 ferredoxin [Pseudonocardia thermophila]
MRVEVDLQACAGHGQCAATAPGVFALDDDGFVLPVGEISEDARDEALQGAAACPEHAIEVVE